MNTDKNKSKKLWELVSDSLYELFNKNIVSKLEVKLMEIKIYSRVVFSITYPLIIKNYEIDEKKNKRYWSTIINIYGINYRICNDWYKKKGKNNISNFAYWLDLKIKYINLNKECKSFIEYIRNTNSSETCLIYLLKKFYNDGKVMSGVSKNEINHFGESS